MSAVEAEGRTFRLGYNPDDPPLAVLIQRRVDARDRARRAATRADVAHYEALLAEALAAKIEPSTVREGGNAMTPEDRFARNLRDALGMPGEERVSDAEYQRRLLVRLEARLRAAAAR